MFQLDKNRTYIDRNQEAIELSKRFLMLFPLFLSCFICQHYSRPEEFTDLRGMIIQLLTGIGITLCDFTPKPNIILTLVSIAALIVNNNHFFIILHEYFVYGVAWSIANQILDYEDSQKLFPGLALLQNMSYYITIWINNPLWLIIPYVIILGYRFKIHSWKSTEIILNLSKRGRAWWMGIMSMMVLSYSACYTLNTDNGVLKHAGFDPNFELFSHFELDYMAFKGICTFLIFFIINTSVFMHVRWRFLGLLNAFFLCTVQGLLIAFPNINSYNYIMDTINIGLYSYFFDPNRAVVYSMIDDSFAWNQIPINVIMKPLVMSSVRFVNYLHMYLFPVFVSFYLYMVFLVNNEFSDLSL